MTNVFYFVISLIIKPLQFSRITNFL